VKCARHVDIPSNKIIYFERKIFIIYRKTEILLVPSFCQHISVQQKHITVLNEKTNPHLAVVPQGL